MSPTCRSWLKQISRTSRIAIRRHTRLRAEALEDRTAPAIYNVTTTADVVNPNDGLLSLREAVLAANASVGVADTINLPAATYALTLTGAAEEGAATGDLDVWDDVTIQRSGIGSAIVDGNLSDRVFDIQAGRVSLVNLTIRNGAVQSA